VGLFEPAHVVYVSEQVFHRRPFPSEFLTDVAPLFSSLPSRCLCTIVWESDTRKWCTVSFCPSHSGEVGISNLVEVLVEGYMACSELDS
jgi:hypothetical protein